MMFFWIALAVVAVVAIMYYNRFVRLRNKVEESWSGVDVQLKRRYDLIPNLLETVKGYAKHEKELFENVTKARTMAMSAEKVGDQSAAENMLSQSLKSLFAVAENYPDLKANANFQQFQQQLSQIEEQIQLARRYYNAVVRDNNNAVETFPGVLLAGPFGFHTFEYFEAGAAERENVQVKF
ncbi:MAG: LemA family protein [Saprospiraceae bacterium]|nr:LemA family protein [Saprospiraceae bacterium]